MVEMVEMVGNVEMWNLKAERTKDEGRWTKKM
jgi:hypothetical protein